MHLSSRRRRGWTVRYQATVFNGAIGNVDVSLALATDVIRGVDLSNVVAEASKREDALIAAEVDALVARLRDRPNHDDLTLARRYLRRSWYTTDGALQDAASSAAVALEQTLALAPSPVRLGLPSIASRSDSSRVALSVRNVGSLPIARMYIGLLATRPGETEPLRGYKDERFPGRFIFLGHLRPGDAIRLFQDTAKLQLSTDPASLHLEAVALRVWYADGTEWMSRRLIREFFDARLPGWL